jgi:hypothetical protein
MADGMSFSATTARRALTLPGYPADAADARETAALSLLSP